MNKFYNFLAFLLLIAAILCVVYNRTISENLSKQNSNINAPVQEISQEETSTEEKQEHPEGYKPENTGDIDIIIPVNRPVPLSGKLRLKYIKFVKAMLKHQSLKTRAMNHQKKFLVKLQTGNPG